MSAHALVWTANGGHARAKHSVWSAVSWLGNWAAACSLTDSNFPGPCPSWVSREIAVRMLTGAAVMWRPVLGACPRLASPCRCDWLLVLPTPSPSLLEVPSYPPKDCGSCPLGSLCRKVFQPQFILQHCYGFKNFLLSGMFEMKLFGIYHFKCFLTASECFWH